MSTSQLLKLQEAELRNQQKQRELDSGVTFDSYNQNVQGMLGAADAVTQLSTDAMPQDASWLSKALDYVVPATSSMEMINPDLSDKARNVATKLPGAFMTTANHIQGVAENAWNSGWNGSVAKVPGVVEAYQASLKGQATAEQEALLESTSDGMTTNRDRMSTYLQNQQEIQAMTGEDGGNGRWAARGVGSRAPEYISQANAERYSQKMGVDQDREERLAAWDQGNYGDWAGNLISGTAKSAWGMAKSMYHTPGAVSGLVVDQAPQIAAGMLSGGAAWAGKGLMMADSASRAGNMLFKAENEFMQREGRAPNEDEWSRMVGAAAVHAAADYVGDASVNRALKGTLSAATTAPLKASAKRVAATTMTEGLTEGLQNQIEQHAINDDYTTFDEKGFGQNFTAGAVMGGVISGAGPSVKLAATGAIKAATGTASLATKVGSKAAEKINTSTNPHVASLAQSTSNLFKRKKSVEEQTDVTSETVNPVAAAQQAASTIINPKASEEKKTTAADTMTNAMDAATNMVAQAQQKVTDFDAAEERVVTAQTNVARMAATLQQFESNVETMEDGEEKTNALTMINRIKERMPSLEAQAAEAVEALSSMGNRESMDKDLAKAQSTLEQIQKMNTKATTAVPDEKIVDIEDTLNKANPEQLSLVFDNIVRNTSQYTPEEIKQISEHKNTPEPVRNALRLLSESTVAENAAKESGQVRDNILNGEVGSNGKQKYMGLNNYTDRIASALKAGNTKTANYNLGLLEKFSESHSQKAALAEQALASDKPSQFLVRTSKGDWELKDSLPDGMDAKGLRANGGLEIRAGYSTKLVAGLRTEADLVAKRRDALEAMIGATTGRRTSVPSQTTALEEKASQVSPELKESVSALLATENNAAPTSRQITQANEVINDALVAQEAEKVASATSKEVKNPTAGNKLGKDIYKRFLPSDGYTSHSKLLPDDKLTMEHGDEVNLDGLKPSQASYQKGMANTLKRIGANRYIGFDTPKNNTFKPTPIGKVFSDMGMDNISVRANGKYKPSDVAFVEVPKTDNADFKVQYMDSAARDKASKKDSTGTRASVLISAEMDAAMQAGAAITLGAQNQNPDFIAALEANGYSKKNNINSDSRSMWTKAGVTEVNGEVAKEGRKDKTKVKPKVETKSVQETTPKENTAQPELKAENSVIPETSPVADTKVTPEVTPPVEEPTEASNQEATKEEVNPRTAEHLNNMMENDFNPQLAVQAAEQTIEEAIIPVVETVPMTEEESAMEYDSFVDEANMAMADAYEYEASGEPYLEEYDNMYIPQDMPEDLMDANTDAVRRAVSEDDIEFKEDLPPTVSALLTTKEEVKAEQAKNSRNKNRVAAHFTQKQAGKILAFVQDAHTKISAQHFSKWLGKPLTESQATYVNYFGDLRERLAPLFENVIYNAMKGETRISLGNANLVEFLVKEDGTLDENVKTAMALAVVDTIQTMGLSVSKTDEAVKAMLGMAPTDNLDPRLYSMYARAGDSAIAAAQGMGRTVTQALGLRPLDSASVEDLGRLQNSIGMVVFEAMRQYGAEENNHLITITEMNGHEQFLTEFLDNSYETHSIDGFATNNLHKFTNKKKAKALIDSFDSEGLEALLSKPEEFPVTTYFRNNVIVDKQGSKNAPPELSRIINLGDKSQGILSKAFGFASREVTPALEKPTKEQIKILGKAFNTEVPVKMRKALLKTMENPFRVRTDFANQMIELMDTNMDGLKSILGIGTQADLDGMHESNRDATAAVWDARLNSAVKALNWLKTVRTDKNTFPDMYLPIEVWVNHRMGYASNVLNPQGDTFHRNLVAMGAMETTITPDAAMLKGGKPTRTGKYWRAIAEGATGVSKKLTYPDTNNSVSARVQEKMSAKHFLPVFKEAILQDATVTAGVDAYVSMLQGNGLTEAQSAAIKEAVDYMGEEFSSLQSLYYLAQMKMANGKRFKVMVTLQSDGVTNGPILTQISTNSLTPEQLFMGGFVIKGSKARSYTQIMDQGSRDMYEHTGDNQLIASNQMAASPIFQMPLQVMMELDGEFGNRKGAKKFITPFNYASSLQAIYRGLAGNVISAIHGNMQKINQSETKAEDLKKLNKQIHSLLRSYSHMVDFTSAGARLEKQLKTLEDPKVSPQEKFDTVYSMADEFIVRRAQMSASYKNFDYSEITLWNVAEDGSVTPRFKTLDELGYHLDKFTAFFDGKRKMVIRKFGTQVNNFEKGINGTKPHNALPMAKVIAESILYQIPKAAEHFGHTPEVIADLKAFLNNGMIQEADLLKYLPKGVEHAIKQVVSANRGLATGQSVRKFAKFIEARDRMTTMGNVAFNLVNVVRGIKEREMLGEVESTREGDVTLSNISIAQQRNIDAIMDKYIPRISSPTSVIEGNAVGDKHGFSLVSSERGFDTSTNSLTIAKMYDEIGEATRTYNLHNAIRTLKEPGVAPIPSGIQGMDAYVAQYVITRMEAFNIHDAHAGNLDEFEDMGKLQNEAVFQALANYHIEVENVKAVSRSLETFMDSLLNGEMTVEDIKAADLAMSTDKVSFVEYITKEFPKDVKSAYLNSIGKLDLLASIELVNQYGAEYGAYQVTEADYKALEETKTKLKEEYRAERDKIAKLIEPLKTEAYSVAEFADKYEKVTHEVTGKVLGFTPKFATSMVLPDNLTNTTIENYRDAVDHLVNNMPMGEVLPLDTLVKQLESNSNFGITALGRVLNAMESTPLDNYSVAMTVNGQEIPFVSPNEFDANNGVAFNPLNNTLYIRHNQDGMSSTQQATVVRELLGITLRNKFNAARSAKGSVEAKRDLGELSRTYDQAVAYLNSLKHLNNVQQQAVLAINSATTMESGLSIMLTNGTVKALLSEQDVSKDKAEKVKSGLARLKDVLSKLANFLFGKSNVTADTVSMLDALTTDTLVAINTVEGMAITNDKFEQLTSDDFNEYNSFDTQLSTVITGEMNGQAVLDVLEDNLVVDQLDENHQRTAAVLTTLIHGLRTGLPSDSKVIVLNPSNADSVINGIKNPELKQALYDGMSRDRGRAVNFGATTYLFDSQLAGKSSLNVVTILHELVHAASVRSIKMYESGKPMDSARKEAIDNLKVIFDALTTPEAFSAAEAALRPHNAQYALQSFEEFLAVMTTMPDAVKEVMARMSVTMPRKIKYDALAKANAKLLGGSKETVQAMIAFYTATNALMSTPEVSQAPVDSSVNKNTPQQIVRTFSPVDIVETLSGNDKLNSLMERVVTPYLSSIDPTLLSGYSERDVFNAAMANNTIPYATDLLASGFVVNDGEMLAYEFLHTAIEHSFENSADSLAYRELFKSFEHARNKLSPESFYKGNWETATDADKQAATQKYNYLFEAKDNKYLSRFAAMASVTPEINEALQITSGNKSNLDDFDKLTKAVAKMVEQAYDKAASTSPHMPIASNLSNVIFKLASIDQRARNKVAGTLAEQMYDSVESAMNAIGGLSNKVTEGIREIGKAASQREETISKAVGILANENLDKLPSEFNKMLDMENRNEELGPLRAVLNEIAHDNDAVKMGKKLFATTKQIEALKQSTSELVQSNLKDAFGENWNKINKSISNSITELLRADTQALLAIYSPEEVADLIANPASMDSAIAAFDKRIRAFPNGRDKLIQAGKLVHLLRTGDVIDGAVTNAKLIATGWGTSYAMPVEDLVSGEEVNIDTYVSLMATRAAMNGMSSEARQFILDELAKGGENGMVTAFRTHQYLAEESRTEVFGANDFSVIKGYLPNRVSQYRDVQFADVKDTDKLVKAGYTLVRELPKSSIDSSTSKQMALFAIEDSGKQRRISGFMSLSNTNRKGNSVDLDYLSNPAAFKAALAKYNAHMNSQMKSGVASKKGGGLSPSFNSKGEIIALRYIMSHHNQDTLLQRNNDFHTLLGDLAAQNIDRVKSPKQNEKIIDALYEEAKANMSKNPNEYVQIGINAPTAKGRELYALLPYDVRARIIEHGGNIKVSNRILNMAFGFNSPGIMSFLQKDAADRGDLTKHLANSIDLAGRMLFGDKSNVRLAQGERLVMDLIRHFKDIIVIRNGITALHNFTSNALLLNAYGVNPIFAAKEGKVALQHSLQFRKDFMGYKKADINLRAGLGNTKQLEADKVRYMDSMERNPLYSFIAEHGMQSTIVDDVALMKDHYDYQSPLLEKVSQFRDENISTGINSAIDFLTVAPNTKLYKFMSMATSEADLMGKWVLFKWATTQAKDKVSVDEGIELAHQAFINYDIPTTPEMQWANNVGLLMFTKYNLRIQKAILHLMSENPGRLLTAGLMSQMAFGHPNILGEFFLADIGNPFGMPLVTGVPTMYSEPIPMRMLGSLI